MAGTVGSDIDLGDRRCEALVAMGWDLPPLSKTKVNKAGELLATVGWESGLYGDEIDLVNAWRSAHRFPLNTAQMALRRMTGKFNRQAFVGQRLKRFTSICGKLKRNPGMRLGRMQDIGGCRAVVGDVAKVQQVVTALEGAPRLGSKIEPSRKRDYVTSPARSGYRSVHLVYKFEGSTFQTEAWDGLEVEMQVRSSIQHAWAAAVETVDLFMYTNLKSGVGDPMWLRFFALMGSACARKERTPLVPGTPENRAELASELRELVGSLGMEERLAAWRTAMQVISPQQVKDAAWYLLRFDMANHSLNQVGWTTRAFREARIAYERAEREAEYEPGVHVVLVSASSYREVRRMFPSYFNDIPVFADLMREAIKP